MFFEGYRTGKKIFIFRDRHFFMSCIVDATILGRFLWKSHQFFFQMTLILLFNCSDIIYTSYETGFKLKQRQSLE